MTGPLSERLREALDELRAEQDRADQMAEWLRAWLYGAEVAALLAEHDAARRVYRGSGEQ